MVLFRLFFGVRVSVTFRLMFVHIILVRRKHVIIHIAERSKILVQYKDENTCKLLSEHF